MHQGRTRKGIDCAGLIVRVAHELGLSDYDSRDYQRRTSGHEFLRHFRDNMKQKPISLIEPGDVILFRDKMYPCHSAFVADDKKGSLTIIHAFAGAKKVVEEKLDQGDWLERVVGVFEFHDVGD